MKNPNKYSSITVFSLMFLFLFCAFVPVKAYSQVDPCMEGIAVPPFLGEGFDPDLLLIIDNSGSMLDLAYVDPDSQCFDDTYNPGSTYSGYFEENVGYLYNFVTNQFEPSNFTEAEKDDFLNNADFKTKDLGIYGTVVADELTTVDQFGARGNFLNWAMASKLDVQKKILTGGKYDDVAKQLIMESRGCGARRHAKKVEVTNKAGVGGYYLNLGISPPPEWRTGKDYSVGDVVSDNDTYYIVTSGGTSSGTGVLDDAGVKWGVYDTSLTHVEIFKITAVAIDYTSCDLAVNELSSEKPSLGDLGKYTDDCLGFASNNTIEGYSNAAFNHSLQNCWYYAKFDVWQPGVGSVSSIKTACERIYSATGLDTVDPWDITASMSGYICYGVWDADPLLWEGYVGRCWVPGGTVTKTCVATNPQGKCVKWDLVGTAAGDWIVDPLDKDAAYNCVDAALKDFCGVMEVPEVIDPSDLVGTSPETDNTLWNVPAILIGAAMGSNLGEPIAVMKGIVVPTQKPTGLIQEFASTIRMGAMVFNASGSGNSIECTKLGKLAQADCGNALVDRDGGRIISYIGQDPLGTPPPITQPSW